MFLRSRSNRGFITIQAIVFFVLLNFIMTASFLFGSKIREVQDTNFEIKRRERVLQEQKDAEERRRQQQAAQTGTKQPAAQQKKVGIIEVPQNQQKPPAVIPVTTGKPVQLKKLIVVAPVKNQTNKQPDPVKQPVSQPVQQASQNKPPDNKPKPDPDNRQPSADDSDIGFSGRLSSLFSLSEMDSMGVQFYDMSVVEATRDNEATILRLINRFKIAGGGGETVPSGDTTEGMAINQRKVDLWAKKPGQKGDTPEVNVARPVEFIGKFLYAYKEYVYIGSGSGVRRIRIEDVPDANELKKDTKFKHEEYLPDKLPPTDTIAMCSNGANIIFWGTVNDVYMIDLDAESAVPLGSDGMGIVELLESGKKYSICHFRNKLYFVNSDALFCYDIAEKRWRYITYDLFTDYKCLDVSGILVFEDPKEALGFALLTYNVGIIIGRMPAFDLKLTEYEGKYRYKARRAIALKNNSIPPRDFVSSPPCYAFGDANNLWISFLSCESVPCELIRYDIRDRLIDKISENCERHFESQKVEYLYAADMAVLTKDITVAVNGVEVFGILRYRDKDNDKVINYGFISICKLPGSYAVTVSANNVICSTSDGKILKVTVKL